MIDRSIIELDAHVAAPKFYLVGFKVCAVVSDDAMGAADHAKSHHRIHTIFMVYDAEAVLPCDIIHDSPRVRMYEEKEAELDRQDSLDALEEEAGPHRARPKCGVLLRLPSTSRIPLPTRNRKKGREKEKERRGRPLP